MQLTTANDTETSETAYLEVIKSKTAKLFSAACRLGAVVAERPAIEEEALTSFGLNLGIAFQLVDDVLDYSAPQAVLGKAVGDDFRGGKITLPIILAFRRGNDGERDFWRHALEELEQEGGDLERAVALLHQHGALADTTERARHYAKLARDALDIFAAGDEKAALIEAVDFSIERNH